MKKLAVLLSFLLLTACAGAQNVEVNKKTGEYRVRAQQDDWQATGITADSIAARYPCHFSQAIASPCQPIVVSGWERIIRCRPFKKLWQTEKGEIIYDPDVKNISYQFSPGLPEERWSFQEIPAIIAIILMALSNIFLTIKKIKNIIVGALLAALAAISIMAAAALPDAIFNVALIGISAGIAAFASFFAIIFFTILYDRKIKIYFIFSLIFYALAATYFIVLYQ